MTESAIFLLTELIFSAWYNEEYITSLFCDLTIALDCVSHGLFILKLEFFFLSKTLCVKLV